MTSPAAAGRDPAGLHRFMYLWIGAAILTIALTCSAAPSRPTSSTRSRTR
ncbi:hypothetical protein [Agromyces sp. H66]|nr:hypothetical protein [Agromyces sp. H66]